MRRKMLGMSQGKLAEGLGLTFQQVQKYEKGSNRIGASRLQHIAHILQVPVPFFFEDAPSPANSKVPRDVADISEFFATSDGLALCAAFMRIENRALRRSLADLVEQIAASELPTTNAKRGR